MRPSSSSSSSSTGPSRLIPLFIVANALGVAAVQPIKQGTANTFEIVGNSQVSAQQVCLIFLLLSFNTLYLHFGQMFLGRPGKACILPLSVQRDSAN